MDLFNRGGEEQFDRMIAERDREDEERAQRAKLERDAALGAGPEVVDESAAADEKALHMRGELTTAEAVRRYALGGKATLTLENVKTGTRFTYRLDRAKPRGGQDPDTAPIFVSVLVGTNNVDRHDYRYLGTLWTDGAAPVYRHGKKSSISPTAPSARGAEWLLRQVAEGRDPRSPMKVWHEGRCGRCRAVLTVPESIKTGLGPVCARKGE